MIVQGYYYNARIVLRSLQENAFYYLCFAESNEYAERWFKKLRKKKAKQKTLDNSIEEEKQLTEAQI